MTISLPFTFDKLGKPGVCCSHSGDLETVKEPDLLGHGESTQEQAGFGFFFFFFFLVFGFLLLLLLLFLFFGFFGFCLRL
jgi:hypothetical protein